MSWTRVTYNDFYHAWNARYGRSRAVDEVFIDHGIPVWPDIYDATYANDDAAHAAPLFPRAGPYGDLVCTDEDWYKFTMYGTSSADSEIQIAFDHEKGQLELFVYDSSMNPIGSRTGWQSNNSLTVNVGGRAAGTYYIKIAGVGNQSDGDGVYEGDMSPNYALSVHVNAAPTARNDSFSVAEDSGSNTLYVLNNDDDPDPDDSLQIISYGNASHGSLTLGSGATSIRYTPAANYNGSDSFWYTITDSWGSTSTATVSLSITSVNDQPVIGNQTFSVAENKANGSLVGTVVASDPDAGQSLTFAITGGNTGGAFSINAASGQIAVTNSSALDYEVRQAFNLTVQVTDNGSPVLSRSATVTINLINVVEQAPVIAGISNDTGTLGDGLTSDRTLVVSGTAEPGMTITVYRGGSQIGTTTAGGSGAWTFDYTGTSLADGEYAFTATAKDSFSNVSDQSVPCTVTVDGLAPAVEDAMVNGGAAQRTKITSLATGFSEAVVCDAGSMTLTNLTTSEQFDLSGVPFDLATGTWDLSGVELTNGYYSASVSAGAVQDLAGNPMAADYTFSFHRLAGDTTGDTVVDAADYIALKCSFGRLGGAAWDTGDLDGDGRVGWSDLQMLIANAGASLGPAPAAAPTPADPVQAGVAAPMETTAVPDSPATTDVAPEPALQAMPAAEVQDAMAEPESQSASQAAPAADEPVLIAYDLGLRLHNPYFIGAGTDVLAMAASVLGNRLIAGRQSGPSVPVGPGDSQPTVPVARRVGPASIPSLSAFSSPLPMPSAGRAGEAFVDVLSLASPWWRDASARYESPDEPWMDRLAVDITGRLRKARPGPIGLDVLAAGDLQ